MAKNPQREDEPTQVDPGPADKDPIRTAREGYEKTAARSIEDEAAAAERAKIDALKGDQKELASKIVDAEATKRKADAEYATLQAQASMKNAELLRLVGTPSRRPTTIVEYAAQAKANGEPMVQAVISKRFNFRLDDHTLVDVLPGARRVPKSFADHWWARANDVVAID